MRKARFLTGSFGQLLGSVSGGCVVSLLGPRCDSTIHLIRSMMDEHPASNRDPRRIAESVCLIRCNRSFRALGRQCSQDHT